MNRRDSPPRRLTRAQAKEQTRAQLLDAAAEVVTQKGFDRASVEEIADAAGYSTGAVYSNFAGKEDLFLELLARRTSPRHAEATAAVRAETSPQSARSAVDRLMIDVAEEDVDLAPLQAEMWLYAIRRPELQARLANQFRDSRDTLASSLTERLRGRGVTTTGAHDDLAAVLIALFQGLVQLRRTDPSLVPNGLYGTAARWLFTGIAAPRDDPHD